MIVKEDIKKLADLARIGVEDEEAESLAGEIDAILAYVGQVKSVVGLDTPLKIRGERGDMNINVFREDENPTPSGTYSEALIAEFPEKEGDYLRVKKIL